MSGNGLDLTHGAPMANFMRDIQKTVVQQPDFRGIGGHGPENHGPHGLHSQVNIGIGNTTLDFRLKP